MRHGWVLCTVYSLVKGEAYSWQLVWKDVEPTGVPDITVARATLQSELSGSGRLFFKQQLHVRRASSNVLAFRRLLRRSSRNLPPLSPSLHYDTRCVPRWQRASGVAFLLHVSKSGGTALREVLLRGPGLASKQAVRFAPHFPEAWQDQQMNLSNFSVGRLHWSYEKRHALEHGSVGMVPGGHLAWELQMPRLMELAAGNLPANESEARKGASGMPSMPCLCTLHFDSSLTSPLHFLRDQVLGLAMFRSPVQRFLSHFYYARHLDWTSRLHLRRLRPAQYLHHPMALLDTLMVWQDGMAGTAWLAGYSIHVGAGSTSREADDQRLWAMYKNRTKTLSRAVQAYHKLMFVGLLEDLEGSMRLLQALLRWPEIPQIQKLNAGKAAQKQSPEELVQMKAALRVLAPMDMWMYQYISQDFQVRLKALAADEDSCYVKGMITAQPEVRFPSEGDLGGCTSSRERIACGAEIFEG